MNEEYIIEYRTPKDWQKVLNQWKHEYTIEILSSILSDEDNLLLIVKRTKK